jgi:hypothetical protein
VGNYLSISLWFNLVEEILFITEVRSSSSTVSIRFLQCLSLNNFFTVVIGVFFFCEQLTCAIIDTGKPEGKQLEN